MTRRYLSLRFNGFSLPWSTNQTVRISAWTAAGERTQPSITYRTPNSVSSQNRPRFPERAS